MQANSIFQELDAAVLALVCGDGPLRDRLDMAAAADVQPLAERDFPPDARSGFNALKRKIMDYQQGSAPAEAQAGLARVFYQFLKQHMSVRIIGSPDYRCMMS